MLGNGKESKFYNTALSRDSPWSRMGNAGQSVVQSFGIELIEMVQTLTVRIENRKALFCPPNLESHQGVNGI